jgi:hypothetical protein
MDLSLHRGTDANEYPFGQVRLLAAGIHGAAALQEDVDLLVTVLDVVVLGPGDAARSISRTFMPQAVTPSSRPAQWDRMPGIAFGPW